MPTTIAVTFPVGRYHATPWDHAVNDGIVEWPPSPWRILRALIATRHDRWPDLSEPELDGLMMALRDAPSYSVPAATPAQTRHYMPDLESKSGARTSDLVLDPFLWVDPDQRLLVQWRVDLPQVTRQALGKLCELAPYLGRSESIARLQLLDVDPEPDSSWWQPGGESAHGVRLLAPGSNTTRAELELPPALVRKRRLPSPPTSVWANYAKPVIVDSPKTKQPEVPSITAIRWRLVTKAPFKDPLGILAAEHLRWSRLRRLSKEGTPSILSGKEENDDDHSMKRSADGHLHAHWLWMSDGGGANRDYATVRDLLLWLPAPGLDSATALRLLGQPDFGSGAGWKPNGFRSGQLYLVALGDVDQVAPELVGPSRTWTSRTPYLPVRYRKKSHSVERWVRQDIAKECDYRGIHPPVAVEIHDDPHRSTNAYRRYRWKETMAARREAVRVTITFQHDINGPLCLGALSHFGFGLLAPQVPGTG